MHAATLVLLLMTLLTDGSQPDRPVSLCDVFRNATDYEHKEITVTGGFRVGYEWQELVCFACPAQQRVWVDFNPDAPGLRKLPRRKADDELSKVTFRGTLIGGGGFGHLNGYAFIFHVNEVKSAKHVWRLNPGQSAIPKDAQLRVCDAEPGP